MGRGRQKAKQTKVARKLKYYSPETDYDALQRELQAERKRDNDDDDAWRYEDLPSATDDDDWYDDDDRR
ncbi:MAG: DUF3073 domain-containing protein [Actinomycetaceae bacterium]|nr:DUF3073 domain-containing protein [Actinomycetaceae bacterium]MDU0971052.1 DUF3073 domain-containing protein [Actinomycetaceae bacterium]